MRLVAVLAVTLATGAAQAQEAQAREAQAREVPPLEHARCYAIAVHQGYVADPSNEHDRAVLLQGEGILERDWQGYLENTVEIDGDEDDARAAREAELYEATDCAELIGADPGRAP